MSKKSYLTHGIVTVTAIIIVSFELLPLTSWRATITEIQNENRIYADQIYDEHIVAVVTTTGSSTILNLKGTLPHTKKNNSDNLDLRIGEDIVKSLEEDAKRRGISINSLVNNALKNYITSDQYFEELGQKLSRQHKTEIAREFKEEKEDGTTTNTRTRILENQAEMIKEIKRKNNAANKLSICTGFGGMQMSYNYLFDSYKNVVDKYRKKGKGEEREGYGLRWITHVDKDSLDLVKIFLKVGIQVRHVKNMPPLSFGVSENEVAITIDNMMGGKMSQSFLISNELLYVNHFNSLFEQLWKDGIDAAERIKDIELGADLAEIEVIPSSAKAQEIYLNMVKEAKEEVILIFPSTNAFIRQDKIGAIKLSKQAAQKRNVKVRLLMPAHKSTNKIVQKLQEQENQNVNIRYIEQMSETKATILVVDRNASLVMEIRDDSKTIFVEAIGLSTYSNSKAGVLSYVAIFENLWIQSKLYEQLKLHDKMQTEFINIAAHELRTPIQPILSLSQLVYSNIKDIEQRELLDAVIRNAKRLKQLTEDILDITRIESKSLKLNKELFNLDDVISTVVEEYKNQIEKEGNDIELVYATAEDNIVVLIDADRARITQVIFNLLSNAIKFTKKGTITIKSEKEDHHHHHHQKEDIQQEVIVSVKDTGEGIDHEILPRLFSKFATKSYHGTGLGLFISKSIVQAHSGRIWAENNTDGKGATFYFSLPLSNRDI
jgi:two-component system, OmpR family, sensor histidine kinase VicK